MRGAVSNGELSAMGHKSDESEGRCLVVYEQCASVLET